MRKIGFFSASRNHSYNSVCTWPSWRRIEPILQGLSAPVARRHSVMPSSSSAHTGSYQCELCFKVVLALCQSVVTESPSFSAASELPSGTTVSVSGFFLILPFLFLLSFDSSWPPVPFLGVLPLPCHSYLVEKCILQSLTSMQIVVFIYWQHFLQCMTALSCSSFSHHD